MQWWEGGFRSVCVYPALLYTKRYGTLYTETISPEEGEGDEGTPAPIRRHVHGKAVEEETSGAVSLFIWPTTHERVAKWIHRRDG